MTTSPGAPRDLGPAWKGARGFRARAEARQREYRARVLQVGWSVYGHMLEESSATAGRNFLTAAIHDAARARARAGKGVAQRTFDNMLASQAMCFNVFAPLAADTVFATSVLAPMLDVAKIDEIEIEHTPEADIFRDQSALGGVDCDVLVQATGHDRARVVVAIETKFVVQRAG